MGEVSIAMFFHGEDDGGAVCAVFCTERWCFGWCGGATPSAAAMRLVE